MNHDPAEIALQNRKFAKTCVEKKRRDRINKCLDELKDLMAQSDDKARYQKMEKAEILEMAVAYMRNIRLNNPNASFTNTNNINNSANDINNSTSTNIIYSKAYAKCLSDMQSFVCLHPGIHDEIKSGLVAHLSQRVAELVNENETNNIIYNNDETVKIKKTKSTNNGLKVSPAKKSKKSHSFPTNSMHQFEENVNSNEQRLNQMSIMTNTSCSNSSQNVSSLLDSSSTSYSPYLYHHHNNRAVSTSPALSESDHLNNNHNESQISNSSSSPALSQCSSPISSSSSSSSSSCSLKSGSHNEFRFNSGNVNGGLDAFSKFANFELYQSAGFLKMWRPW